MKAVILSRVSTVEQQEDGCSIKAQRDRLISYCEKREFDVVRVFEIIESSTRGDRKKFYEMIDFIKKQKEKIALVADAVDRVQRGFTDSMPLDELRKSGKLDIHFYREGIVLNEDSNSADIIRWDYAVIGAKTYVLNIRDNVIRSFDYKIRNGEWCCKAPIGYLNVRDSETGKSMVILDKERAHLVKRAFELYATASYSFRTLAEVLKNDGLNNNNKHGKPLSSGQVHKMLTDPFYYGMMRWKNELYPHKYEHIIDKSLFDKCQSIREGYHKKPFKYASKPFALRGLIKCAHCGCMVSFYKKKGKYVYGSCSKYKGQCGAITVKEESLLSQISVLFEDLAIPEDVLVDLKGKLQQSHDAEEQFHRNSIATLRCEYDKTQRQLKNLLDMRISESITQSQYDEKATELKSRQHEIDIKLKQHTKADESFRVTVSSLLDLASRAKELFESSKPDEKRQFINFVLSNLTLKKEKLQFNLKEPFDAIVHANKCKEWYPRQDSNL